MTVNWKPISLKSAQSGNDVIVNAAAVVMLTPIGGKAAPTCQVLLNSGHNVLFVGSTQEISQAIAAAMAGQPQPKPATNLPPDLRTS
jgi:hypothetical protein